MFPRTGLPSLEGCQGLPQGLESLWATLCGSVVGQDALFPGVRVPPCVPRTSSWSLRSLSQSARSCLRYGSRAWFLEWPWGASFACVPLVASFPPGLKLGTADSSCRVSFRGHVAPPSCEHGSASFVCGHLRENWSFTSLPTLVLRTGPSTPEPLPSHQCFSVTCARHAPKTHSNYVHVHIMLVFFFSAIPFDFVFGGRRGRGYFLVFSKTT